MSAITAILILAAAAKQDVAVGARVVPTVVVGSSLHNFQYKLNFIQRYVRGK